jgi:flagellar biosynthesis/type III secretory pathway protein FliH
VEEGRAAAMAEMAQLRDRLENSVGQLGAVRDSIMARSEDDLVDLALLIAEALVSGDADARQRFTRDMARQALQLLDKAEAIRLRVHPNERGGVEAAVQSAGADVARRVTIIDDISVGAGGVIAECELGRVDASFAEALRNIARGLKPGGASLRLLGAEP